MVLNFSATKSIVHSFDAFTVFLVCLVLMFFIILMETKAVTQCQVSVLILISAPFVSLHVLSGETIKIVIEEYVQHLSGYLLQLKFDPPLLFNTHFQYGNRISLEFSQLYHWHPLMPDSFFINGDELLYEQFLFNTSVLTHYGIEKMVDAFSRQPAGQVKNTDIIININILNI